MCNSSCQRSHWFTLCQCCSTFNCSITAFLNFFQIQKKKKFKKKKNRENHSPVPVQSSTVNTDSVRITPPRNSPVSHNMDVENSISFSGNTTIQNIQNQELLVYEQPTTNQQPITLITPPTQIQLPIIPTAPVVPIILPSVTQNSNEIISAVITGSKRKATSSPTHSTEKESPSIPKKSKSDLPTFMPNVNPLVNSGSKDINSGKNITSSLHTTSRVKVSNTNYKIARPTTAQIQIIEHVLNQNVTDKCIKYIADKCKIINHNNNLENIANGVASKITTIVDFNSILREWRRKSIGIPEELNSNFYI